MKKTTNKNRKTIKTIIFGLTILGLISILNACSGECYNAANNENDYLPVNNDTNLCTGIYNNVTIFINSSTIVFDCNGSTLNGTGSGYGIINPGFDNVTIKNCNVMNYDAGIYLYYSSNNTLINNTANLNNLYGIILVNSTNSILKKNTANLNNGSGGIGIALVNSTNNTIIENTANLNNFYGVYFDSNSTDNGLTSNFICNNTWDIRNDDSNSGDNNTCTYFYSWNDTGAVGGGCRNNCMTTGSISGYVNYSSGTAAPGVNVTAVNSTTGEYAGSALADGNGDYVIYLLPGFYNVSASKQGYSSNGYYPNVQIVAGAETVNADFTMTPSIGSISGYVNYSSGTAASGVNVTAVNSTTGEYAGSVLTDGNGNYIIYLLPGFYNVSASKPGYSPNDYYPNVQVIAGAETINADFTMIPPIGSISGYVNYSNGSHASGVNITAVNSTTGDYAGSALTDGNGDYVIYLLPGFYNVSASKPGYSPDGYYPNVQVIVGVEIINADFTMEPTPTTGSISGYVNYSNGTAASGVNITSVNSTTGEYAGSTLTDGNGNYTIILSPGVYNVSAYKEEYLSDGNWSDVEVTAGFENSGHDFTMDPIPTTGSISGYVNYSNGTAASEVNITANLTTGEYAGSVLTDVNGNYTLELPVGEYNLSAYKEGFMPDYEWVNVGVAAGEDNSGHDFTMLSFTFCDSCSNCSGNLNGSYDVVMLDANISDYTGNCINFNANKIIFDCNGNEIVGNDSSNHYGIYMNGKSGDTIRNCAIMDFSYGIFINNSDFINIYGNYLTENNEAIKIENSNNSNLNENYVCGNDVMDIMVISGAGNSGDNNTCDSLDGWNDTGRQGCTNKCTQEEFNCVDLNNDGIITNDYKDLMTDYKCFLGINQNCDKTNYQNWNLMKKEYNCFMENKN